MGKIKTSQGTMKLAQAKIRGLVSEGHRLNPNKASTTYLMSVADKGKPKERRQATKIMDTRARGKGSNAKKPK